MSINDLINSIYATKRESCFLRKSRLKKEQVYEAIGRMIPVMRSALEEQKKIYDNIQGKLFFSSPTGAMVDTSHLRQRIWKPALEKAGLDYREMKQTHAFFFKFFLEKG